MQTMTSCFNYHYGTCYRPVFIPPYDNEKPLKIDKPNIGFTANVGIEQNFHKLDKLSSWNFGFGPNFHKMNSKNTLFCGISFKNYINKEIYDGSLFGVNVGVSHLTKYKFNYFTNVDVNFGSNNITKFYNSYGVNLGTRINDFLLFHDTHFGMDIYGRFEYSSKELQFQDNIYVGIKLYYGFFGR